ncbi:MAG: CHAT domain-containing protein [Acidobacteria bacterium]|nr:CHAT domain-containing protein [Acidobacteriota bacterium]
MTLLLLLAALVDIERAISLTNELRLDEAAAIAQRVHAESIECEDLRARSAALDVLGIVARMRGDPDAALSYTSEALFLAERIDDPALRARAHNDLGRIYFDLFADGRRARGEYQRGLALPFRDAKLTARLLNNLGNVAQSETDFAGAIAAYERALRTSEKAKDRDGILAAEHNIGFTLALQNEPARALPHLRRALAIEQRLRSPAAARTLLSISEAQRALGQNADALRVLEQARDASARDDLLRATVLLREGDLRLARGDLRGAARDFDASQKIVETKGDAGSLPVVLAYRAKLRRAEGRARDAARLATEAAERAAGAGQLDTFAQARSLAGAAYRELGDEAAARTAFGDAVEAIERTRTRVAGGRESRQLFFEGEVYPYLQLIELHAARGDAAAALEVAERAKARALRDVVPSGALPDGPAVEFAITESKVFAFVLPQLRIVTIDATPAAVAALANRFARELAERNLAFRTTARQLHDLLIAPLALPPTQRLIVVPDRELWRVPFAALIDAHDRYLVETTAITLSPSLRLGAANARYRSLFAAGHLPDSGLELAEVGALYPRATLRDEATEREVKAHLGEADVIHIAAHGIFEDAAPLESHLLLRDGKLTARELMEMHLTASLVVLSACETATGRIAPGEGLVGMTWALFLAGCPTVVATEWKIESGSARRIVVAFHRNLVQRGRAPADALREAQLALMRETRYAHPFYWAGFVVIGR